MICGAVISVILCSQGDCEICAVVIRDLARVASLGATKWSYAERVGGEQGIQVSFSFGECVQK